MPLHRVPVVWQTGAGGTGLSVFYTNFGSDATTELGTFFNAIKANVPAACSWNIPSSGDVIDETTGFITGSWIGGVAASIAATGAGAYAAGTGCYIRWQTSGIVAGRRVRGRTFICPILGGLYQGDGTIADATLAQINTAANTLVLAGKLRIWHRPTTRGSGDGAAFTVTAAQGPDKVTSLRSRRV
jgi:hypothetical protein